MFKLFDAVNSCDGRFAGSLDVRFTSVCDNACAFCIERPGIPDRGTDVAEMIQSALAAPQQSILVLGGEPLLLLDRVIEFVEAVRLFKKEIFVTTSLPRSLVGRVADLLLLVGMLDGLNVSLQHYDWRRNNEILATRNRYDRVSFLKELLADDEFACKARVSINLVRGGVDSAEELNVFLDALQGMGCRHVKVNELQGSSANYVSFERMMGVGLPSPFSHGCQTDEPLREGMRVTLKRSCFLVEDSLTAGTADVMKLVGRGVADIAGGRRGVRHGVMYEDGRVENGWLVREEGVER